MTAREGSRMPRHPRTAKGEVWHDSKRAASVQMTEKGGGAPNEVFMPKAARIKQQKDLWPQVSSPNGNWSIEKPHLTKGACLCLS